MIIMIVPMITMVNNERFHHDMKKFAILDVLKNGDTFGTICDTIDNVFREADKWWNRLTESEQYQRETFVVLCIDLDIRTFEVIRIYK